MLLSQTDETLRIDSEYYKPDFIKVSHAIRLKGAKALASMGKFIPGPFGSEFHVENYDDTSPYRYVRGKDVKPFFLTEGDNVYLPHKDYERLHEFWLQENDVLISVVGTLGNAAIVTSDQLPAIYSCKSTAFRAKEVDPWLLTAYLNSSIGQGFLLRNARGTVQMGLNLPDLKNLPVPNFSNKLQYEIVVRAQLSWSKLKESANLLKEAESLLMKELGLQGWQPPQPRSYVRQALTAFSVGRLDAEFFAPSVMNLIEHLRVDSLKITDIAATRREKFVPQKLGEFDYIEIGDVQSNGVVQSERLQQAVAPSRATWHVRAGDVITSTVRPIRRLSAIVNPEQDGFVCSSGFVVFQPTQISSELLFTYLRLPQICQLMNLYTSSSMYPAIAESDLLSLPFRKVPAPIEKDIIKAVKDAQDAHRLAQNLIMQVKHAVNIAIEHSEADAMQFLAEFGE